MSNPGITSLEHWFDLDETSGDRQDEHTDYTLTDTNTVGSVAGKVDTAADFVLANSEALVGVDQASVSFGNEDFTVGLWVKLGSVVDWQALMGKWDEAANLREWLILYNSAANRFRIAISASGSGSSTENADELGAPNNGEWYFVVAWHDSVNDILAIQVNDGTADERAYTSGCADRASRFVIGAQDDGAGLKNYAQAAIDGAFIYRRVLTDAERTWLYNNGAGRSYRELITDPADSVSLEHWFALDEASGDRVDSHVGYTLTDTNTVASAAGKKDDAADFEAGNSEALVGADQASVSFGDEDFTVGAWVKGETLAGTNKGILTKYDSGANLREWQLLFQNSSSRFRFEVSPVGAGTGAGAVEANGLGAPSNAVWYFVVAWHDAAGNTLNIQVNNRRSPDSAAYSAGCNDNTSRFVIGARDVSAGLSDYFDGLIDEAFIFRRVLTAEERAWLYNGGAGRTYTDLFGPQFRVPPTFLGG